MNIYVYVCWRSRSHPQLDPSDLADFIPTAPKRGNKWQSVDELVDLFSFQLGSYHPAVSYLHSDKQGAVTFDGYPLIEQSAQDFSVMPKQLFQRLSSCDSPQNCCLQGEYSVLTVTDKCTTVVSNSGGSHPVFYTSNDELTAVSNRGVVLLGLPGVSDELSVEAASWLCYQGYVQNRLTAFREIRQMPPGGLLKIRHSNGLPVVQTRTFDQIVNPAVSQAITTDPMAACAELCKNILSQVAGMHNFYNGMPFEVPLSAGKDSRVALSLLQKAGLQDNITRIYTKGPLYSPDVLGAQDICRILQYSNHEVIRSPQASSAVPVNIDMIYSTLSILEGNSSLYDYCPDIEERMRICITGQQAASRENYFGRARTDLLENFLDDALRLHFHDPAALLLREVRKQCADTYRNIFISYHEEGIPVDTLGHIYMPRERYAGYGAQMCNANSMRGPSANPLLLDEMLSFGLSIPAKLRDCELIHFILLFLCEPQLTSVPFANDRWHDKLRSYLLDITEVPRRAPYRNSRHFPNMRNPYLPSDKMNCYRALKPAIVKLVKRHRNFLTEYLDIDQLDRLLASSAPPLVPEILCVMGLYTTLFTREFGRDLFRRTCRQDIQLKMTHLIGMDARVCSPTVSADVIDTAHEELIERHESCIAHLVRDIQRLEEKCPVVEQEENPSLPWKHVNIENTSSSRQKVKLKICRDCAEPYESTCRIIEEGETFCWGVQIDAGQVEVIPDMAETQEKPLEIEPTILKYYVKI